MKHIKTYESLHGEILRLNPNRRFDDNKAKNIIKEIKIDFEKFDKNLLKVKIVNDNGDNIFSNNKLEIGNKGNITYIFGKHHSTNNDIHTANNQEGNRKIEIHYFPFSIDKSFDVSKMQIRVKETIVIDNPNYDSNSRKQGEMHHYDYIENKFKISPDIANKILKYFIEEYKEQYPELKKSRYLGPMQINNIKRGIKPTIKYLEILTKDGKRIMTSLRSGDNEEEFSKMVSNMTEEEYGLYNKGRDAKANNIDDKKKAKKKHFLERQINKLIQKSNIKLPETDMTKYRKYGFYLKRYGPDLVIEFRISTEDYRYDLETEEEEFKKEFEFFDNINGYYLAKDNPIRLSKSYNNGPEIYVTIFLDKED
tara:strand:- start:11856 stop:12953 length:1098 start_codon:yes stop_codon:yes gene_type:complete